MMKVTKRVETHEAKIVNGGGEVDGEYRRVQIEFAEDVDGVFRIGERVVLAHIVEEGCDDE